MSGDDLKSVSKYIADHLEVSSQVQLFVEAAQAGVSGSVPKEVLLLLTNRRVILFRRKTGLLRGINVKRTYSILDIVSIRVEKETDLHIRVRCTKEEETVLIKTTRASVQRIINILYDSLRFLGTVRSPEDVGSLKIPETTLNQSEPTPLNAVSELYLTICDQIQHPPLSKFLDYLKNYDSRSDAFRFDLARGLGRTNDKQITKASAADVSAVCGSLRNQNLFTEFLVRENYILSDDSVDAVVSVALSRYNQIRRLSFRGNNWSKGAFKRINSHIKFNGEISYIALMVLYHFPLVY